MCAHAWQLVVILDAPVAIYSEQAQEHWNKYLTEYKCGPSARARQHSVSLNIYDTFVRMLSMSHLMVAGKQDRLLWEGHSSKWHAFGPNKREDSLYESFYTH